MCDPITLVVGGMSLLSGVMGGIQENRQAKADAAALNTQAEDAQARSAFDQAQMDREAQRRVGALRAGAAGRGGKVDSGGNLDQQSLLIGETALDKAMRGREGTIESNNLRTQAKNRRAQGKSALTSGVMNGVTGALGAAGGSGGGFSSIFGSGK
ncbi:MAG: hypothetical protein AAF205_00280 [Pseudomonadota bacterium]